MPRSLVEARAQFPSMAGLDLASRVSTHRDPTSGPKPSSLSRPPTDRAATAEPRFHVVAYDFGIKHNILRRLVQVGCRVTVVPALTSAEDVLALKPDGVFLSNGPGDPEPLADPGRQVRKLIGKKPDLRHLPGPSDARPGARRQDLQAEVRPSRRQSSGAEPRSRNKVEITSHNHGFAVDPDSLNLNEVEITHVNLNDQTLEGFRHRNHPVFCVQYHPEAAPGPHDSHYLFDDFVKLMKEAKSASDAAAATIFTAS